MKHSQQEIHKVDMSGESISPEGQVDMLISGLLEQIRTLAEVPVEERNTQISMMSEYIRGYRDGFRMMRKDPYTNH